MELMAHAPADLRYLLDENRRMREAIIQTDKCQLGHFKYQSCACRLQCIAALSPTPAPHPAPDSGENGWDEHDRLFPDCSGDDHCRKCDKATGERMRAPDKTEERP